MENGGYAGDLAPPAHGVNRSGSYMKRKISEDYNANQFPADGRRVSSWSRKASSGEEPELPELVPEEPGAKKWAEKTGAEKGRTVLGGILKFLGLLTCLYFFICALDLLGSGFNLLGGKATGQMFRVRYEWN